MVFLLGCGQHSYFMSIKCSVAIVNKSQPPGHFCHSRCLGNRDEAEKNNTAKGKGVEQPSSLWGRVSKEFLLTDGQGWGEGWKLMMEDGRNHKVRIR